MRFRRLELVRYGGFADRVFDFGDGEPDLHLVVGPNEAGKSTALQAIGDFLFGIPGQSGQAWRYDYAQLRLRALVEHDGDVLDVTRRKGNRDTLLKPDGAPFEDDPLAPLLGGVDRAAFERMFGLDHAKLRLGGKSILDGRDEAARITLEAGTGFANIGSELKRLEEAAAALFKPAGQNPPVNKLLRERTEALARLRQSFVSDADWTAVRGRRAEAERRRAELIAEGEALDREQARLDRIGRARAPLGRLAHARRELEGLSGLPELPLDAAERLTTARTERSAAGALEAQMRSELARVDAAIAGIEPPGRILALRSAVEALDERRPVIANALEDLERCKAELERIDARVGSARAEARIAEGGMLPTAGWRKRAGTHLEARRELRQREAAAAGERSRLRHERQEAERELADLGEAVDPSALSTALDLFPADAEDRLASAEREAARKVARASDLLAALAPWRGDVAALRALEPPSDVAAGEARRLIDAAKADETAAREAGETAEATVIRARARLAALAAGGPLPTPEAVARARALRDGFLSDVRDRLASDRQVGDAEAGRSLAEAMRDADALADRRDGEAARVADHGLAVVGLDEAEALRDAAAARRAARLAEAERHEQAWHARLLSLGFERSILPAEFPGWSARRATALEADRERTAAEEHRTEAAALIGTARTRVATALAEAGLGGVAEEEPRLAEHARLQLKVLTEAAADRAGLLRHVAAVDEGAMKLDVDEVELARARAVLEDELDSLMREAGLRGNIGEAALIDALGALGQVAEDIVARDGLARQIARIERDRDGFDAELARVLETLATPREGRAVDMARGLGVELRRAIQNEAMLTTQQAEHDRLTYEAERARHRLAEADLTVDALMRGAGVESEVELDRLIADYGHRAVLRTLEGEALVELAGLDAEAGLEALAAEVAALGAGDEAVGRNRIDDRRREVAAEREAVGRDLNAAEEEARRIAGESAAADAQQAATETTHALAQASEEHVEAAAAAALLRWVIDRHRATNQAPLIARAGALFAKVTGEAFSGLAVGYDRDDRPSILARRADGSEVPVDALSEGTRDQLYLALRLGSIEARVGAGALPVICDDLLITADDGRAAALLRVLAAAAEHSQVIVFSHHEHLIDVATKAIGGDGFRLHRIEPTAATKAATA